VGWSKRLRRRWVRELVPALIGIGAAALITVIASQNALGHLPQPKISNPPVCASPTPPFAPSCSGGPR
jgi:hypothetical protein